MTKAESQSPAINWRIGLATSMRVLAAMFLVPVLYLIVKSVFAFLFGGASQVVAMLRQYSANDAAAPSWDAFAILLAFLVIGSFTLIWGAARISPQRSLTKSGK